MSGNAMGVLESIVESCGKVDRVQCNSPFGGIISGVGLDGRQLQECGLNGAEEKYKAVINGVPYIVKLQKRDWLNVWSEVIGSRFIEECGGNVQHCKVGVYNGEAVALCKEFTGIGSTLKSLKTLSESGIDTDDEKHSYFYEDVLYELSCVPKLDVKAARERFQEMYLYDAILGNPDRHKGNWGILRVGDTRYLAPIYDNGACLFPRNHECNITEDWMRERVFTFPNSKVMFNGIKERSSYYDICGSGIIDDEILEKFRNLDVVESMVRVCKNIGLNDRECSYYASIVFYRHQIIIKRNDFVWKGMV